jgi:hypothetical protein
MVRVLTPTEYQNIVNSGADYCDCCGGLYEMAGLSDNPAMMADLSNPLPNGGYPLLGGHTVCYACSEHCEDGPCQPENLVDIRETDDELARQHQHEENQRLLHLPSVSDGEE